MSKFLRAAVVLATFVMGATAAQAQFVGMAGEYTESNGIIVQIPQNPPIIPCTPASPQGVNDDSNPLLNDSRCMGSEQHFFGTTANPPVHQKPSFGNNGAQIIPTQGAGPGPQNNPAGLNPGDPFLIPPLAFQQRLGKQVGIVLNNVTIQLDTTFTAAMPGTARTKGPTTGTRRFSAMNWSVANLQNNGSTVGGGAGRLAATTVHTAATNMLETIAVTYNPGPNEFGGVMTILLDGAGRLYLGGPPIDGLFPTALRPVIGSNPVGDMVPGFNIRNAAGWDYTVTGSQMAGRFKAYGPGVGVPATIASMVVSVACGPLPPPTPAGCNEVNGFDTFGVTVAPLPGATSTKHMFAWTTGSVTIQRTAIRQGGALVITDTNTGMGYDTTTMHPATVLEGTGTVTNRNVGMIAGSYTFRTDGLGVTQINQQMAGVNLKFTPEPGATVALISGLGLLGGLAARRRS
jgi:hypothetical protein